MIKIIKLYYINASGVFYIKYNSIKEYYENLVTLITKIEKNGIQVINTSSDLEDFTRNDLLKLISKVLKPSNYCNLDKLLKFPIKLLEKSDIVNWLIYLDENI